MAVGNEVYVSSDGSDDTVAGGVLWSIDARTGALRWKQDVPGFMGGESSPAVAGDAVYVGHGTAAWPRQCDGATARSCGITRATA